MEELDFSEMYANEQTEINCDRKEYCLFAGDENCENCNNYDEFLEDTNNTCYDVDEPICPWCESELKDSFEYTNYEEGDHEINCPSCGEVYFVSIEIIPKHTSTRFRED